MTKFSNTGFTLIELSIALIIIGLIVGGVLVGQDLIGAAAVRAQITQIEKYNTAVNTFREKYGGLPGDITPSIVKQFGFLVARAGTPGRGDGDGLISCYSYSNSAVFPWGMGAENTFFWADLSQVGLIEGSFTTVTDAAIYVGNNSSFAAYFPAAKIGNSNYVSVFTANGINYFQIINPYFALPTSALYANRGMTIKQAYGIDKKIDDGLPTKGSVLATMSVSFDSSGYSNVNGFLDPAAFAASTPSSTTCYDTTSLQYSLTPNGGNGVNCALSFKFQ